MKKLFILLLCFSTAAISCNNSSGSANTSTAKDSLASAISSHSVTSGDKGTFTCTIDGKPITIKVTNSFFEMTLDPYSKGPKDGIELLDGSHTKEGFQFEIKKEGTTTFRGMAGVNALLTYFNSNGVQYLPDEESNVIANVTSYNGTHVTGTFSGKFNRYEGAPANNAPASIMITDGKFDLQK